MARPLVAERSRRDDDVAEREARHERTGAADRDDPARPERDQLLEPARRERRTDAGERETDRPAFQLQPQDGVAAHLGDEIAEPGRSTGFGEPLVGRLLMVDARALRFETLHYAWDPGNPLSGTDPEALAARP